VRLAHLANAGLIWELALGASQLANAAVQKVLLLAAGARIGSFTAGEAVDVAVLAPALLCILSRGAFGLAHGAVQEVALAAARAHAVSARAGQTGCVAELADLAAVCELSGRAFHDAR